ncbi:MAG: hypothetical protein EZS28_048347 [Streblomastix strix]|uniref:Uncharacterized protein n=1 Tax=Streblomastix strix TaxID=222440 RepID=A0A5J4TCH3_9EUKA|nr:MAG: hypothetical protein EZS28_048347 [Streblomastix strix]
MIHNESTNKMSTPTQTKDTKEIDLQQEDNKEREREREQRETDERLKRVAERLYALEQVPDINIIDLLKTFEEELWEMINLYKHDQIIEYGNFDMILLTQPISMELLYNVVTDFRDRIADEVVIAADKLNPSQLQFRQSLQSRSDLQRTEFAEQNVKNSPALEFYKNDIKNFKDCDKFLDKVFEQERMRPFKISFDFGTVIQRSEPKSQDRNKIPMYSIVDEETDKIVSYRMEFNILLVTNDCGNSHIMYIADVNGLLGIKICPMDLFRWQHAFQFEWLYELRN